MKILKKKLSMERNSSAIILPTVIISGAGLAAAGYFTYKYFQNKNHHWEEEYSSSGSYYTLEELGSDDEYFDVLEEQQDFTDEDLLYVKVDRLMEGDENCIEEAYLGMKKYLGEMSEYPNFLWRYAKVHHLKGKVEEDKAQELNTEGLIYASKAVDKDPKNPEAHKWFAILKGMEAEFTKDISTRIDRAKIFSRHIREALKLRPFDWELHHLWGVFEYKFASLSYFEKAFAKPLFKDIITCDYQVAEDHFRLAERFNPRPSKDTKLFLAKCLFGQKDFKRAFEYLNQALDIKLTSIHDKIAHREAESLKYEYMKKV